MLSSLPPSQSHPNPTISALGHGAETPADALSDYIPQSNEVSRVPSTAGDSVEPVKQGEEEEAVEEEEEEEQEDSEVESTASGDVVMKEGNGKKLTAKKEAKKKLDDKVCPPILFPRFTISMNYLRLCADVPFWTRCSSQVVVQNRTPSNQQIQSNVSPTFSDKPISSNTSAT